MSSEGVVQTNTGLLVGIAVEDAGAGFVVQDVIVVFSSASVVGSCVWCWKNTWYSLDLSVAAEGR